MKKDPIKPDPIRVKTPPRTLPNWMDDLPGLGRLPRNRSKSQLRRYFLVYQKAL
jgi:hypothetical protein